MNKYFVEDASCETIRTFYTKDKAINWLEKYCYHDGVNWLIKDVSHFPYNIYSRVLHLREE